MIETKFEFTEEIKGYIDEMHIKNRDLLNQALSMGASKVNKSIREAMKSSYGSEYQTTNKFGIKRSLIVSKKIGKYGDRFRHTDNLQRDNPKNMYHMIKNYLDEKNNLVVIMGRHPSFVPVKFRDGKRLGRFGKRISGTGKGGENNPKDLINILEKMNKGGTVQLTKKQSMFLSSMRIVVKDKDGKEKIIMPNMKRVSKNKYVPLIKTVTYKRRLFAERGFAASAGSAMGIIKSEYEKHFSKVMNEIERAS